MWRISKRNTTPQLHNISGIPGASTNIKLTRMSTIGVSLVVEFIALYTWKYINNNIYDNRKE